MAVKKEAGEALSAPVRAALRELLVACLNQPLDSQEVADAVAEFMFCPELAELVEVPSGKVEEAIKEVGRAVTGEFGPLGSLLGNLPTEERERLMLALERTIEKAVSKVFSL